MSFVKTVLFASAVVALLAISGCKKNAPAPASTNDGTTQSAHANSELNETSPQTAPDYSSPDGYTLVAYKHHGYYSHQTKISRFQPRPAEEELAGWVGNAEYRWITEDKVKLLERAFPDLDLKKNGLRELSDTFEREVNEDAHYYWAIHCPNCNYIFVYGIERQHNAQRKRFTPTAEDVGRWQQRDIVEFTPVTITRKIELLDGNNVVNSTQHQVTTHAHAGPAVHVTASGNTQALPVPQETAKSDYSSHVKVGTTVKLNDEEVNYEGSYAFAERGPLIEAFTQNGNAYRSTTTLKSLLPELQSNSSRKEELQATLFDGWEKLARTGLPAAPTYIAKIRLDKAQHNKLEDFLYERYQTSFPLRHIPEAYELQQIDHPNPKSLVSATWLYRSWDKPETISWAIWDEQNSELYIKANQAGLRKVRDDFSNQVSLLLSNEALRVEFFKKTKDEEHRLYSNDLQHKDKESTISWRVQDHEHETLLLNLIKFRSHGTADEYQLELIFHDRNHVKSRVVQFCSIIHDRYQGPIELDLGPHKSGEGRLSVRLTPIKQKLFYPRKNSEHVWHLTPSTRPKKVWYPNYKTRDVPEKAQPPWLSQLHRLQAVVYAIDNKQLPLEFSAAWLGAVEKKIVCSEKAVLVNETSDGSQKLSNKQMTGSLLLNKSKIHPVLTIDFTLKFYPSPMRLLSLAATGETPLNKSMIQSLGTSPDGKTLYVLKLTAEAINRLEPQH